ncbi:vWA-like protein [Cadophora sp. DSE1049]|nr:vWA-like protein [Cadophora sp. DSE1049]
MRFSNTTALAFVLVGSVLADPGVSPASVSKDADPGTSFNVNKVVTTPEILPKPDVVLLIDVTGSMGGSIENLKTNLVNVISDVSRAQPNAQFAVASFGDFGDPNRFQVDQALTSNAFALQNAVNSLKAGFGGDESEDWINALFQLSTTAITFRGESSRIIVLVSDAPSHEPSNGHTLEGDTIAALMGKTIRVIGVNVGAGQLDKLGQATKVTTATGGVIVDSAVDTVTKAIVSGLKNLEVTVKPDVVSCDVGLTVKFAPTQTKVSSGAVVTFHETAKVADDATQGDTLQCFVRFLLNDTPGGNTFIQRVAVAVNQMGCFTCDPHPGKNLCHSTTSCAPTPYGTMCLTRPGYKADGTDDDNVKVQWRMKWPGHEHRVAVVPGTSADTLCSPKHTGPDVCKEVKVADCKAAAAPEAPELGDRPIVMIEQGATAEAAFNAVDGTVNNMTTTGVFSYRKPNPYTGGDTAEE